MLARIFILSMTFASAYISWSQTGYDISIAEDCTRERVLLVDNQRVLLHKGEVYSIAKFLYWRGAYVDGFWFFKVGTDTIDFDPGGDSFILRQLNKKEFALTTNDEFPGYLDSTPGPIKQRSYKVIWSYILDYDTIIKGRCYSPGGWLLSIAGLNDTFKADGREILTRDSTYVVQCGCAADSNMYGTFQDEKTGEYIRVTPNRTVFYKSTKKPNWVQLYSKIKPGDIQVWFTPKHNGNIYTLYFTGDLWLLPGDDRLKPQFFKPVSK